MEKKIVVFSDAHYAKNWDTVDIFLGKDRHGFGTYLNPNQELRKFIALINQMPNVEAVINNGDAVDYFFSDFSSLPDLIKKKARENRSSNIDLFNNVIAGLAKQYHAVPGNHDYRKEAYNYAIWGMEHINVARHTRKKHKKQIGHHTFRGPWEIVSIMADTKRNHFFKKCISIKKRQDLRIADYHCIFLDTGSDAFIRAKNFFGYAKKLLKTRQISFDSHGLGLHDLEYLSRVLKKDIGRDVLIFQHAPLLHSKKSCVGKQYQLSMERFEQVRCEQKIAYSTIFNGGAQLLDLLRHSAKNIVIVSSHIHSARYFLIDKRYLTATEVSNSDFNEQVDRPEVIKQVTSLPLGGLCPETGGTKTGFLNISSKGFVETVLHDFS